MPDPPSIFNWHRLDQRITSSGQPTAAQFAELAALGVRCVINLAPHNGSRALPDEPAIVAGLGMEYVNIPVDFANPPEADFTAFCAAMAGRADRPVHVHCAANYRVSAFLFRWRRDVLGIPAATARADLDRIWTPNAAWSAFIERRPAS